MKVTILLQRAADNLAHLPAGLQRGWSMVPPIYCNTGVNEWTHTHCLPASERLCVPSEVKGTSGKTQCPFICAFTLT